MSADSRRTTPALIQQGQWATVPDCKRMLVVVHTITYAQRLQEVVQSLESDLRVQVVFTVAPHAFGQGARRYLHDQGIATVPWRYAVNTPFDLALAAGSQGMHAVRAPVIRLSHGAGHIKLLRDGTEETTRGPGMLSRRHLLHDGRVMPTAIALAHARELDMLSRSCPEALPVATVVGDPSHDRVLASRDRRHAYRRALGLGDDQQLVVVASTWGRSAAFGRLDTFLPRLLGELPGRRFRVAVLVHPNVWSGHGPWQVHSWLAGGMRHGALLVPPEANWQSLLVASDFLIGDHGSVTAYGTLADVPILMSGVPRSEVAPDSPAAALAALAPALSSARPLGEQLRYAAERYRSGAYDSVAALISSAPGEFQQRMRGLLYRALGLGEPAYVPRTPRAPLPPPLSSWKRPGAGRWVA
ncbi:hypothetical protein [Streptomyces avicenniae]|uniref:hypothetical protein n=1 Tax=Streptomyces avicenniae TaxID=500153 RepID=UPI000DA6081D|nr:hypothetical protein [Streptomyces avicenniae]